MTDPAQAFLNYGNVDQWTRGAGPITGIGTTMVRTAILNQRAALDALLAQLDP